MKLSILHQLRARLARRLFYQLYGNLSCIYDWVADLASGGEWQNWIQTVIPFLQGSRVLEIGFGPGHLLPLLSRHGYQVIGIDASPQMARRASKNWKPVQQSIPPLCLGRNESLPFRAGWFSTAVATFPAPFLFSPNSLLEIQRVLSQDGIVIILLSAQVTGKRPVDWLARLLNYLTGQSIKNDEPLILLEKVFTDSGFSPSFFTLQYSNAILWLVSLKQV